MGVNSRWKAPLYDYPKLGALCGAVFALVVFRLLQPRITGTPPNWPFVIAFSLVFGLNAYLFRVGTRRFLPIYAASLSVAAIALCAFATFRIGGIPRCMPERMLWAFVIALAMLGLGWAVWAWTHATGRERRRQP